MAKITQNNFAHTVNETLEYARKKGIIHLVKDDSDISTNQLQIKNQKLVNFGTCGYLGLENHPEIIEGITSATLKFGAQFSVSRCYLDSKQNIELEELLSEIFSQKKVIVYSSTTLTHMSVIPILMQGDDLVLVDQQAHISMQQCLQMVASKGTRVELIRHNNLESLEHRLKVDSDKYRRVWYVADGVYSMFGDLAPVAEINRLMTEYPKLYAYMDDAHGMSWYGKYGSGRLFQTVNANARTIYVSTLAKGFGTMGGLVVFPDEETYWKVKMHGGPLAYSHPIPPPMLGGALASAHIHLSTEIQILQNELAQKVEFVNSCLQQTDLLVMSSPDTPICFAGMGLPELGFKVNKQLLDEGYYANIAMFPAVPAKNTGIRFTVTNHHTKDQIKGFIDALSYYYKKSLEELNTDKIIVARNFEKKSFKSQSPPSQYILEYHTTIHEVSQPEWDMIFSEKGNFSWEALRVLERGFSGNELPEDNWGFHYFIIRDRLTKRVQVATFFTSGLFKDDLTADPRKSSKIEELRRDDPYFLTSRILLQGSMITDGEHLYVRDTKEISRVALNLLMENIDQIVAKEKLNGIFLRDYRRNDDFISSYFQDKGFVCISLPNTNHLRFEASDCDSPLYDLLTKESKRHIRRDVLKYINHYRIDRKDRLTDEELSIFYNYYRSLAARSFDLNLFPYPMNFFKSMNDSNQFEFYLLFKDNNCMETLVSAVCAYRTSVLFCPLIIGYAENNSCNESYYKIMLFLMLQDIKLRGFKSVFLGFSADVEKRKLGAKQIPNFGFIKIQDTFNQEIMENLVVN